MSDTSKTTLVHKAHQHILGMIFDGELKQGEILQEAVLGERLEMSRTPVREAIKRLLGEGLAEVQGRFTRVRRIRPSDVDDVFFIRLTLEPDCAAAAVGIPPAALDPMEARIVALMQQGPKEDESEWLTDNAFHQFVAQAAGNRATAQVIANMHRRTAIFDHSQVPARFLKGCAEHLDILDALRRADGARAKRAMTAHLEGARDAIFRVLDDR